MNAEFFKPREQRRAGFYLALFSCFFAVVVIGLGAFTRLVDAGLGCPDWPTCYGHALWPKSETEVARANLAFPDMPVEHDKTWPEMVHRYFATGLGVLAIALVWIAWRRRAEQQPFKLPLFLLGFVVLQGLFGMWTVTLKLWPKVVTVHLLGGFATLALLWLLTLRLGARPWRLPLPDYLRLARLKRWAALGLVIVVLQVALGGWTTANYAAVACPDFPTCQNQWLPPMDFAHGFNVWQEIGPNYLGGALHNEARVAIHFSHRAGAVVTLVYLLVLAGVLWRRAEAGAVKGMAVAVAGVVALQVLLGVGNILFDFALAVAVVHNLVGALLLLVLVTLNYQLYTAQPLRAS